jgi:N utilization substance protein A
VATFVVNALAPAEVTKVVLDEESERIEVVVPDEQLSLAIGRRGQNVRLASQLTGWDIDIMTEAEESERRQKEFAERTAAVHGCARRRRNAGPAAGTEGFAERRGSGLCRCATKSPRSMVSTRRRPANCRTARPRISRAARPSTMPRAPSSACSDELREIPGLTTAMLVALGEDGVKTIEDFAGCATDDLIGWKERKDGETAEA